MKKNIFKAVIAIVFIVGAIISFNVEAKAYMLPAELDGNNKSLANAV